MTGYLPKTGELVPPLESEYPSLIGEALQPPLAKRHEARRIVIAQLPHEAGNDDPVGFRFAA